MNINSQFAAPFFIVSSGRSGTTLLRAMLNAHPNVYIPHESDFLTRGWPRYGGTTITKQDYTPLARLFRFTSQREGWGWSENAIVTLFQQTSPRTFAEVVQVLILEHANQHKGENLRLGLKRPNMIFHVERIWQAFPEAKIVHLVRDGRDVFCSYRKVHEESSEPFGPSTVESAALYWQIGINALKRYKNSSHLLEIRYEDLLANPHSILQLVCGHIGITFLSDFFENYQDKCTADELVSSHKHGIHSNILRGLIKNNTNKYHDLMKPSEIVRFELLAAQGLSQYGYHLHLDKKLHRMFLPISCSLHAAAKFANLCRYRQREKILLKTAESRP